MKQTLFLLLFPVLAHTQETTTFTVDTLGRHNVQLTTITTYQRPDSTVYETRSSVRFKNRGEAKKHINLLFAERIAADSAAIENARRHRAGLMASRQALLADLNRGNREARNPHLQDMEVGEVVLFPDGKKCWDGTKYITCYSVTSGKAEAEVSPAEPKLPTTKKPKKKKQ